MATKPGWRLGHAVAVAHPHLEPRREIAEQTRAGDDLDIGAAVLGGAGRRDPSSGDVGQKLVAVTDAEDGNPGVDDLGIHPVGVRGVDRGRTAREDDPGRSPGLDLGGRDRPGNDLRVDVSFPDPPSDQLGVLGPEVDDQDYVVVTWWVVSGGW